MSSTVVSRLRRALAAIAALSAVWAVIAMLTGGFALDLAGISVSSRNPRNPALVALVCAAAAWLLIPDRRAAARAFWTRAQERAAFVYARWPGGADAAALFAAAGVLAQVTAWMNDRPLWLDEQMIALNVRDRPLTSLAGPLWLSQSAPLGWLALERLALVTLGTGGVALRLVPLMFGVGTLLIAVWAGRRWLTPVPAGIFVLLCAVAPWLAHYPVELKHYSADVFFALLLPVVAVRVVDADNPAPRLGRWRAWWACAALAHWFSNGGLLVLPACAALLGIDLWRRPSPRAVLEAIAGAVVFLVSFALHFLWSVRHTLGSDYLRSYWSGGFPAESSGIGARLAWLVAQLQPLAANPGGTDRWMLFWFVTSLGCVLAAPRLRLVIAGVPLTAFVLGGLTIVPLLDRMALWTVPALYFAIASVADSALRLAAHAVAGRRTSLLAAALVMAILTAVLCADIVRQGWAGVQFRRTVASSHRLDDRAAVGWLMNQLQPGDALVTTHLTLPAVWWYAGTSLAEGEPPGGKLPDGAPIFEATYASGGDCAPSALEQALAGRRRVLIYLGFENPFPGSGDRLIRALIGSMHVTADRTFAESSRVVVLERKTPGALAGDERTDANSGCIALQAAARW